MLKDGCVLMARKPFNEPSLHSETSMRHDPTLFCRKKRSPSRGGCLAVSARSRRYAQLRLIELHAPSSRVNG
jgi:hypothetical protein